MSSEDSEDVCVLCCREVTIYAVGPCAHPICYECSTRMRVLCKQKECPICRSDMPFVVFTTDKTLVLESRKYALLDKKAMVAFENESIQKAYECLLEHKCQICEEIFPTFAQLRDHVRRKHEMFYCELCVDNLKIFTFERKCYNRKDLAKHKRVGDKDNTSHRGHPLCEFCDQRFVDSDELYRHLRREHFFCHFCDADGKHLYYSDYTYLRNHFRREHYLCEEEECSREQFTAAFRSEIDLKAHRALKHVKNRSKAEVKQARTLDIDFIFTPRNSQNGESSPNQNDYRHGRYGRQNFHHRKRNIEENTPREVSDNSQMQTKSINTQCVEEFPHLSGDLQTRNDKQNIRSIATNNYLSPFLISAFNQQGKSKKTSQCKPNGINTEDFPALDSTVSTERKIDPSLNGLNVSQNGKFKNWVQKSNKKNAFIPEFQDDEPEVEVRAPDPVWVQRKEPLPFNEAFPELAKKKNNSVNNRTLIVNESVKTITAKPSVTSSPTSETLAQQIFQKCKSKKKKNKNFVSPEKNQENYVSKKNDCNKNTQPLSLSKLYGGLSSLRTEENQENLDPYEDVRSKYIPKQVEDVPWQETVHFIKDDFPPLPSDNIPSRRPPGFDTATNVSSQTAPPPGFSTKCSDSKSTVSMSLSSAAQQLAKSDGKKNLLAECKEDKSSNLFQYMQPSDFDKRNMSLIQKIHNLVKVENSFSEFKILSGNFRQGKISAMEYHSKCLDILGKDGLTQIFSELICLLPDINKQQELLTVHDKFLKGESKNSGAVPKQKKSAIIPLISLLVCPVCEQVLAKYDYASHQKMHESKVC